MEPSGPGHELRQVLGGLAQHLVRVLPGFPGLRGSPPSLSVGSSHPHKVEFRSLGSGAAARRRQPSLDDLIFLEG